MQYGLIGERLKHSYSVEIHNKIADYDYILKEVPQNELDDFMKTRDFAGINVTIPYKEKVIPYLDGISENAQKIGAVNTVLNRSGRLFGYNTDYAGMNALIKYAGIELCGKKVLILGTGGTAKTAFAVAKDLKAEEIVFVSRTKKQDAVTFSDAVKLHRDAKIIINTTPVGMYPNVGKTAVSILDFPELEGVIDAVYNPLFTDIVLNAKEKGLVATGGLYMLAAQAVYASMLFTGSDIDEAAVEKVFKSVKNEKQNIVLIGMPSCGKTTVGKILADRLDRPFYDSDEIFTEKYNTSIPDYFRQNGESEFRKAEKNIIFDISLTGGKIIATGGGAVLDSENVRALKRNGVIVFLDRSLENLTPTKDRPLSSDKEKLENLYITRYPIYKKISDITIDSNSSADKAADSVIKELLK